MTVTDHPPAAPSGPPGTATRPGPIPGAAVTFRTAEAPVAPMDGSSGATRMISETGADTRPWNALEYLA